MGRAGGFGGSPFAAPDFPFKIGQKYRKCGRKAMRGVVFHGDRELELMQFPDPTP